MHKINEGANIGPEIHSPKEFKMRNISMLAVSALLFSGSVFADTWAFDSNETLKKDAAKPFMIEVVEKNPSWTFCEADGKVKRVCYESYAFE